jgi:predicted ABC-type transport system involved in lysophospholipase L1 biosynthesis ATPase subunit
MIQATRLEKTVRSGDRDLTILSGLDLSVPAGEIVCVRGPSGCGKSTLLGLLAGLDHPTAGTVEVAGTDLTGLDEESLAQFRSKNIGFVFQSFHLLPNLTALENVAVPLEIAGAGDAVERARELLDSFGIGERAHHLPSQMSGGEQQRVAIAIGLANEPTVLLADEPTGSLDTENTIRLLEVFDTVRNELGVTVVIVTHDTSMARALDRYVQIRDGKTSTESVRRVAVTYTEQGTAEAVAALRAGSEAGAAADAASDGEDDDAAAGTDDASHEHFTLLDSAGRLQIPADMRDAYRIGGRVKLVEEDGRILIVPSEQ